MSINTQEPERQATGGMFLEVHSIFDTIQGEGVYSGKPATFIRLAGCNLQCTWCDTEYMDRRTLSIQDIVDRCKHNLVVITGGEPLRQRIVELIWLLTQKGHKTQIETNGTLWNEGIEDTHAVFMVSPKTAKIHPKIRTLLDLDDGTAYYKTVTGVRAYPSQPDNKGGMPSYSRIDYITPLDSGNEKENKINNTLAVDVTFSTGGALQLQIHKILGVQ